MCGSFFLFRESLPEAVEEAYGSMLQPPRIFEWGQGGTENHLWQQYISALAMMDGSGFPVSHPHFLATHEAWLRAELTKYLTIGQGENFIPQPTMATVSGPCSISTILRKPRNGDSWLGRCWIGYRLK